MKPKQIRFMDIALAAISAASIAFPLSYFAHYDFGFSASGNS
jgi:hypothetical protein